MTTKINPVPARQAPGTNECRFKDLDELPLETFQNMLKESAEHSKRTNDEILEDYFTHIETTHINSLDVERPKLDNRPKLIIMAGPNGAGKTSIMTKLAKHGWLKGMVYQNQDFIAQNLFGGWNDEEAIKKSAKYCAEEREACLAEMKDLAFETVSGVDKLDFIKRAKMAGYYIIHIFVCTYSPTVHSSRVAIRVMKGGHSIPIKTIISRYMESLLNTRALVKISDVSYILDNSEHNTDAKLLMRFRNGQLENQFVDELPRWAQSILE